MSLDAGTRIGPYEVTSAIGAGGMGEVYRARDTRLNRDVAIKVLPPAFVSDPDRLHRFEQEARAAAALTHPNILAVHDVGTVTSSDSGQPAPYIVSELLEGETLRERLDSGRIPAPRVLDYAAQLAQGLAAAHDRGIIHRDLKPENLFVTRDGVVKILDFGLAKLAQPDAARAATEPPTVTGLTAPGVVMGTVGYMSPEQVRGEAADHRSDIFSFGAILYEMMTGRRAFARPSTAETLSAILRDEPPLPPPSDAAVAPAFTRTVAHCLEKRPADRFQSARDLAFALQSLSTAGSGPVYASALRAQRWPVARMLPWLIAVLALAAALAVVLVKRQTPAQVVRRVSIALPASEPLALGELVPFGVGRTAIALSPDASRIVYVANRAGTPHLVLRALDRFEGQPIPGTDGAYAPFFSPDGASIGFLTENALKRVALAGGDSVTLAEVRQGTSAAWTGSGWIAFADFEGTNVSRVRPEGGAAEVILRGSKPEFVALAPVSGADAVLVQRMASSNPDGSRIDVITMDGKFRRPLLRGGSHPLHAAGHLFFLRGGSLHAQRFNARQSTLEGTAVPVLDGIRSEIDGVGQVTIAGDGTIAYVGGTSSWLGTPAWLGPDGKMKPLGAPRQGYGTFRLSPDGGRIAFVIAGHTEDIWIYEVARGSFVRLTQDGANSLPVWTPDGQRVAFMKTKDGKTSLAWKASDGSGPDQQIVAEDCAPWSFSPDGSALAATCDGDIRMIAMIGKPTMKPFITSQFSEWGARFSPDGKWVAFISDASGRYEIYVRQYSGSGRQWQVSSDGGEEPAWMPDGRAIVYRNGGKLMSARFESTPEVVIHPPRMVFEGSFVNVPGFSLDVASDGRVLVLKADESGPITQLNLILNWFAELRLKVQ